MKKMLRAWHFGFILTSALFSRAVCFEVNQLEIKASNQDVFSDDFLLKYAKDDHSHVLDALKIFCATKFNMKDYGLTAELSRQWESPSFPRKNSIAPIITWIGHATVLIQIGNINILTDPIFYDLSVLYPRKTFPGVAIEHLPKIDFILISHNHRDHLDEASIDFLKMMDPCFLVPYGSKKWFADRGINKVIELIWTQAVTLQTPLMSFTFTFLPAIHWCKRGLFDLNDCLWGSWMLECGKSKIYFAGDSAYGEHFKKIRQAFGPIDTALLPIGPNEPRHLMAHSHVSPQEAIQAFIDLGAKNFVPIHWGTFRLGTDRFDDPINKLQEFWISRSHELVDKKLQILKFGGECTI